MNILDMRIVLLSFIISDAIEIGYYEAKKVLDTLK